MKTRVFEVPKKLIKDFARKMDEHNLDNRIQGVNENGEIEIAIDYEPQEKEAVQEIVDMIYEFYNEDEE